MLWAGAYGVCKFSSGKMIEKLETVRCHTSEEHYPLHDGEEVTKVRLVRDFE